MNTKPIISKLFEIIEPVAQDAGFEVVDIALALEGGWVLRVYLESLEARDDQPETGIGLADCERMSRELSAILDVEDPVPCAYNLEVSSPGLDRPLRTVAHYTRFAGQRAKVKLERGVDNRRNFTGVIGAIADNALTLIGDDGEFLLPLDDIASAKLIPDWDALLASNKSADKADRKAQKRAEKEARKAKKAAKTAAPQSSEAARTQVAE